MKSYNLMIIFAVLCIAQASAQNKEKKDSVSLNRELTLEKEYAPSIRDASKINVLPELKEPVAPRTAVEYAKFSIPFDMAPQLTTLPAAAYFTDVPYSKKRGYLSAGAGTFVNLDGDLGYQILNSAKDRLNIFGSHRSSNGKVKYLEEVEEQKQKMLLNDNLFGLNFDHHSGHTTFFSGVSYTHSSFNYYGNRLPYNSVSSVKPIYPEIDKETNQAHQILDVNAGFTARNKDAFNYLFKIGYSNFSQKYVIEQNQKGPQENTLQLDLDLNRNWGAGKTLGLKTFYKGSFYTLNNEGIYNWDDHKSYSDIGLNPYFFYDGGDWNIRLGVLADVLVNHDKTLNVAPDLELNYRPTEKVLVYLQAKGGVTDNNLKNIHYENRYIAPYTRITNAYSSLDALVGVKATEGSFYLDLFAGYKNFKNEHFYTPQFVSTATTESEHKVIGENFSYPDYRDGQVIKIGGNLKYRLADVFEIDLKAAYYKWDLNEDELLTGGKSESPVAWGKPDFMGNLTLGYQLPSLPLKLDLAYRLETGRQYKYYSVLSIYSSASASQGGGKMKDVSDLSVKATYTFNDTFSFFVKVNNLLFQEYELLYGYPAQNFSVMGGVNIRF